MDEHKTRAETMGSQPRRRSCLKYLHEHPKARVDTRASKLMDAGNTDFFTEWVEHKDSRHGR
jgi:hypothetical protein